MPSIPNINNYGIAYGRISNFLKFDNKDGSKKYMITVAVKNSYANKDGKVGSQYVRTEAYVPNNQKAGIYDILEVGDLVTVNYIVLNDDYPLPDGKMHYGNVLRVQGVQTHETKAVKDMRKSASLANQNGISNSYIETANPFEEVPVFN